MLNNCAIFCSQELGEIPESLHESALDAFTIAVDGGARHLSELGLKPSLWVGDGDSIQTDPKNLSCPVLKFPREKTFSDLEGALTCAGEAYLDGAWRGELLIFAAQGGRLDHEILNMIAARNWLKDMARAVGVKKTPLVMSYGVKGMWMATLDAVDFVQPRGQIFSVLALGESPKVTITGAKYNVRAKKLEPGSLGLSNEGTDKKVQIKRQASKKETEPVFVLIPATSA